MDEASAQAVADIINVRQVTGKWNPTDEEVDAAWNRVCERQRPGHEYAKSVGKGHDFLGFNFEETLTDLLLPFFWDGYTP